MSMCPFSVSERFACYVARRMSKGPASSQDGIPSPGETEPATLRRIFRQVAHAAATCHGPPIINGTIEEKTFAVCVLHAMLRLASEQLSVLVLRMRAVWRPLGQSSRHHTAYRYGASVHSSHCPAWSVYCCTRGLDGPYRWYIRSTVLQDRN